MQNKSAPIHALVLDEKLSIKFIKLQIQVAEKSVDIEILVATYLKNYSAQICARIWNVKYEQNYKKQKSAATATFLPDSPENLITGENC